MKFRSNHWWWWWWSKEKPRKLGHGSFREQRPLLGFSPNHRVTRLGSVQTVGCFAWNFAATASSNLHLRSWVREIWGRGTSSWLFDLVFLICYSCISDLLFVIWVFWFVLHRFLVWNLFMELESLKLEFQPSQSSLLNLIYYNKIESLRLEILVS